MCNNRQPDLYTHNRRVPHKNSVAGYSDSLGFNPVCPVAIMPSSRSYNRLLVAGLGGLLYGVDVGIIGGALPYLDLWT
jgi:hypothetical protein